MFIDFDYLWMVLQARDEKEYLACVIIGIDLKLTGEEIMLKRDCSQTLYVCMYGILIEISI